ncbi:ArsR/SmtB family transcription factor [Streptomyces sp. NPDC004014]
MPQQQLRILRCVAPPVGDFPDFLTPPQASQGVEAGFEAVLTTPRRQLRRDLKVLRALPSWVRPLVDGEFEALSRLGEALRVYYRVAVAPTLPRIQTMLDAERAVHSRAVLDNGVDGLLTSLGPAMRWRPPVLEVDYPVEHDIHLAGRGLRLVPSAFCWYMPVTLVDPDLPPVLVYPLPRGPQWWTGPSGAASRPLANLLGATRAACLSLVENGCTTGELARGTGVSAPAASRHATSLREAGLTTSVRRGAAVFHTLTPLGSALLRASAPRTESPLPSR